MNPIFQYLARQQSSKVKSTSDHFISHVWPYKTKTELMAALLHDTLRYSINLKLKMVMYMFGWMDGL
jgi:hypothetical protein